LGLKEENLAAAGEVLAARYPALENSLERVEVYQKVSNIG